LITLDPPPPIEAAASSLLYSEEFYAAVKAKLRPGGILQQWIPLAEEPIRAAVVRSLMNSFPHVRMYSSVEGWGFHLLASMSPIEVPSAEELAARLPSAAAADLVEWLPDKDPRHLFANLLENEKDPRRFLRDESMRITDDRPFNEYYLLRRVSY